MLFLTKYQWITLHDYVGFVMASLIILQHLLQLQTTQDVRQDTERI